MIKLVGIRRALALFILLGVNAVVGAVFLGVISPARSDAEAELNNLNARISQTTAQINSIKADLAVYQDNLAAYNALERRGFFAVQDRFEAGRVLDTLRERSGLLGYNYNIDAIRQVKNAEAEGSDRALIDSRIEMARISSVLDMNVYALLHNIVTAFPAHARVQSFTVTKSRAVTEDALQDVVQGRSGFIEASVVMDWLTVVPKAAAPALEGAIR